MSKNFFCYKHHKKSLNRKKKKYDDIILTGDLNAHLESINPESKIVNKMIFENNLKIVDTGPSYYWCVRPSWLDVFIVSELGNVNYWENFGKPFIGGHDYIFLD